MFVNANETIFENHMTKKKYIYIYFQKHWNLQEIT